MQRKCVCETQLLLNHDLRTNVYSLKVTKSALVFRLPPIRCITDFTIILLDFRLLSNRSEYLRVFITILLVVD